MRRSPPDTAASVLGHFAKDVPTVDLLIILGMVGYALLAICLYRDRGNPRILPFLVGIRGAATMITAEGPILSLVLTAALLLLIGQGWLAMLDRRRATPMAEPVVDVASVS